MAAVTPSPPSPKTTTTATITTTTLPLKSEPTADAASTVASTAIFSANEKESSRSSAPPAKLSGANSESTGDSSQSARLHLAAPEKVVADWTVPNPKGILSAHVAFARTVDWSRTPLGYVHFKRESLSTPVPLTPIDSMSILERHLLTNLYR
jgi:hypothetical protein